MHPLQFRYIPFHEPLLKPEEWSSRDALLIFPAEASRNAARRRFQSSWSLSSLRLLTMEEFKEQLFLAPSPMLKEEKRTLAFYASLDAEAKEFFRIHTYFQSTELANQFFRLWDECCEARLALADAPAALAAAGIELLPWQEKTLLQLLRIKELYGRWIAARGFSDRIFVRQDESLDFSLYAPFSEIILVNPFQLTGLEKIILRRLQSMDRLVTMLCQLPQGLMDEETLEPQAFSAHELGKHPGQRIFIWECRNEFALYAQFLQVAHQHQLRHAVDVAQQPSTFQHFLSPARFRLPASTAFSESSLYHFFATLGDLIESLVRDGQTGRLLLPLPFLLAALQRREFYHPLIDTADPVQRATRQELAITLLHKLQNDDLLYLDLGGHFFQTHHRDRLDLEPLVRPVLHLVIKLLGVQDLDSFSQIIDEPEGVPIRRILSANESKYSNLLELFYQTLADFTAIGELGVVDAWRALFPGESDTAAARGILRLFLEYIKSKRVRYEWNVDRQEQIELTGFADACNLSYERLALLQVIEGQLPRVRIVPWLFTEQQRKLVGLDTWDDIRLREKYAFFRLALSTPELHLFTIKNIEKNIEPSSFVEELLIALRENVEEHKLPDIDYRGFSRHFFSSKPELVLPEPVREQPDFFSLPFDAARDFPEEEWRLSFYAYRQLTVNPFEYALRTIAMVPEWPGEWKLEMNRKLLGKISQAVFDRCWKHFNDDALPFSTFERIFESYGERAVSSLFADNSDFYYRLPKNHELTYFREFTLPVIRASCRSFFQQLHERYHLDSEAVRVFPETEFTSATEKTPKLYLQSAESGLPLDVLLQGRADLRIETGEPAAAFIVDYKTGVELHEEQLWFYELFYYLIENPGMGDRVRSCFYLILEERFDKFDKNLKKSSKEEFFARFRAEMIQNLLQTASAGYLPARRRSWRENNLDEIIRMEIYHPR
jgi:hypothetical protein